MIVRVAHSLKNESIQWITDHGASILSRAAYPQDHEYEYEIDRVIPLMVGIRVAPGPEADAARARYDNLVSELKAKYRRAVTGCNAYNAPRRRWVDGTIDTHDMDELISTLLVGEFIKSADELELR